MVETGFSGDVILVDQSDGAILEHLTSPAFAGNYLFDIALAPDNTFYVLADQNLYTGLIVHMDLQGDTLGTITVPVTDNPGYLSPEGFGLDPRDGSFWIALANNAELVHIDSSGNLLDDYFVGGSLDDAAVGPDGAVYISQVFGGYIERFDPTTGTGSFFASSPFPLTLTWSAAGDLWVGDLDNGAEEFDSSGNLINLNFDSGASAAEPALSGNFWDTNIFFGHGQPVHPCQQRAHADVRHRCTSRAWRSWATSRTSAAAAAGQPRLLDPARRAARAPRSSSTASTRRASGSR